MLPDIPVPAVPDYRGEFNAKASEFDVDLPDKGKLKMKPRRFLSGAVGWTSGTQTVYMQVNGRWLQCKAVLTIKVVGSQGWRETRG